jgi:hypothetical protein
MRIPSALILAAMVLGAPGVVRAQGTYSGKMTYGLFGPRALGNTLQPPITGANRGIVRDAYGDFLGRNQAYPGAAFPPPRPAAHEVPNAPTHVPPATAVLSGPENTPGPSPAQPAGPDQWLRSHGTGSETPADAMPSGANLAPGGVVSAPVPPPVVVAFSLPRTVQSPADRAAALLQGTVQTRSRSPITVIVENETAILRGQVATIHDRELAENLVRLEPGIWNVKNELIVRSGSGAVRPSM